MRRPCGKCRRLFDPVGLSLLAATVFVLTPCAAAISDEHSWYRMQAALQNLLADDSEVKRDIAEDADQIFAPLFDLPPDRDDQDARDVVDALRDWIRNEKDEWISTRLLQDLEFRNFEVLTPLFEDALTGLSTNLRWVAIRWFEERDDPQILPRLEKLWPGGERPWVQASLVAALAHHESSRYVDRFLALTRSEDPDLAAAAILALGALREPRAVPLLIEFARKSHSGLRVTAIDALERWPDEPSVLDALIEISHSTEAAARAAASRALGSFGSARAQESLEVLALSNGTEPWARSEAVEALAKWDPVGAIPTLVRILHEPDIRQEEYLKSTVIRTLMDIDEPSILEELTDVADSLGGELTTLRESLGRDRSTRDKTMRFTTSCGRTVVPRDPSDPRTRLIVPLSGLRTLRCWEYPGIPGDPGDSPRLPGGTPVAIENHFELAGESWAEVRTDVFEDCWVPLRFIEPPGNRSMDEEEDKEGTMLMRHEFDLPAGEMETDLARGLIDAGLLEVIEPGDEVIGVALTIDPRDFDRVLLLARSCGLNDTLLDAEIYDVVADLAPLYRGHPVLDRFRRAPGPPGGENDEEIDLDLEELSDR